MSKTLAKRRDVYIGTPSDGGGWSWEPSQGDSALPVPTAKLGLWLFLGAVTILFGALTSAYIVRSVAGADWQPLPKPPILWLNTAVLVLSSLVLQWAWTSVQRGERDKARYGLAVATFLGLSFVAGQLLAWRQLIAAGIYLQTNPSSSFFYLLTATHGAHLLGGIVALAWATVRVWRAMDGRQHVRSVELCAIYWHFLLLVWLWLLALMLLR